MSKSKKDLQLGMNASTASNRLVKDLLFASIQDKICFRCGGPLTRETFSIEHKTPWLDSGDPIELFFDLENITYSHGSCNSSASRTPHKKYFSEEERIKANNERRKRYRKNLSSETKRVQRRERYLRTGN